jgi:hypothetical protein
MNITLQTTFEDITHIHCTTPPTNILESSSEILLKVHCDICFDEYDDKDMRIICPIKHKICDSCYNTMCRRIGTTFEYSYGPAYDPVEVAASKEERRRIRTEYLYGPGYDPVEVDTDEVDTDEVDTDEERELELKEDIPITKANCPKCNYDFTEECWTYLK